MIITRFFLCVIVSGQILFVSLFRDGFCLCHCFGTGFGFVVVSGRILFLSLFRDGFCFFCYCFGTDFVFGIAWGRILFLALLGDGFCLSNCFRTNSVFAMVSGRIRPRIGLGKSVFRERTKDINLRWDSGKIRFWKSCKKPDPFRKRQKKQTQRQKNKIRPETITKTKSVPKQ